MGRPRSTQKDLPPFMHRKPDGRFYYRKGKVFRAFKSRDRNAAIAEYWAFRKTIDPKDDATIEPGTVAEIADLYERHPQGLAKVKAEATRDEYKRMVPLVKKKWGKERYALTAEKALAPRSPFLKTVTLTDFLTERAGKRGEVSDNRLVRFVSTLFAFAISRSLTTYNPAVGVVFNSERPRQTEEDRAALDKAIAKANPALRLMLELASVTSIDQRPIRLLTRPQVREILDAGRTKTGIGQEWEITPYVRSIFERAKSLPGAKDTIYVFPKPDGQPFTLQEFQAAFRYAKKKAGVVFQFRDLRKWNIRKAKAEGQDAQEFAGHADSRTTERHYLNAVKKAKPLK